MLLAHTCGAGGVPLPAARRSGMLSITRSSRDEAQAMRGEEGREGRKLILKFPSCEIEAHVPIMKYFLPFHGSSVIPDGREPGKTDPPHCSHPQRLTAWAGTNKGLILLGTCSTLSIPTMPSTVGSPLPPQPSATYYKSRETHISRVISALPAPPPTVSPGLWPGWPPPSPQQ